MIDGRVKAVGRSGRVTEILTESWFLGAYDWRLASPRVCAIGVKWDTSVGRLHFLSASVLQRAGRSGVDEWLVF